jgi:hypothetical protein
MGRTVGSGAPWPMYTYRDDGDLLEWEPVRGGVRDEPVEDGTLTPGLEGEQ